MTSHVFGNTIDIPKLHTENSTLYNSWLNEPVYAASVNYELVPDVAVNKE